MNIKEVAKLGVNGILLSDVGNHQVCSVGRAQACGYGNTDYGFGIQSGVFQEKGHGLAVYVYPGSSTGRGDRRRSRTPGANAGYLHPTCAASGHTSTGDSVPPRSAAQPTQAQPTTTTGQSN